MKTLTFVLGVLLVPSVSFAAPLTQDQANSLISVVQSSPATPASAFTSLITAFSSITIAQANSLINVVQQSPNTPANAFVDMLLAFTVDPIQSTPTLGVTQSTTNPVTNPPAIPNPIKTIETPMLQSVVMDKSEILVNEVRTYPHNQDDPHGHLVILVSVLDKEGNYVKDADISLRDPSEPSLRGQLSNKTNSENGNPPDGKWFGVLTYYPYNAGDKVITFTSGNLTKNYNITI